MSDSNTQPSNAELARASLKEAAGKTAAWAGENLSEAGLHTKSDVALFGGQAVAAGGKEYGQAAYYSGMSIMEGARQQNPNDGSLLNKIEINKNIAEGRGNADRINKGIESFRQKSSMPQTDNSTNKGIASYQSRASGQTANISEWSSVGGQSNSNGQGR